MVATLLEFQPLHFVRPTPIRRAHAGIHISPERRIRPRRRRLDIPVFDWIEMNVIEMPLHIDFVSNSVFPKSTLPYRGFASACLGIASTHAISVAACIRYAMFDLRPALRKIDVVGWQRPDAMQMIGQQDQAIDRERFRYTDSTDCVA